MDASREYLRGYWFFLWQNSTTLFYWGGASGTNINQAGSGIYAKETSSGLNPAAAKLIERYICSEQIQPGRRRPYGYHRGIVCL